MQYTLAKDIVIPSGTKIVDAPISTVRCSPHGEALIGFGKDHCASIVFDDNLMKSHPSLFIPDSVQDRSYGDMSVPPEIDRSLYEPGESRRVL